MLNIRRHSGSSSLKRFNTRSVLLGSPTIYKEKSFKCTQSAIGGVPWKPLNGKYLTDMIDESELFTNEDGHVPNLTKITFDQDARDSSEIWNFVQTFRINKGF